MTKCDFPDTLSYLDTHIRLKSGIVPKIAPWAANAKCGENLREKRKARRPPNLVDIAVSIRYNDMSSGGFDPLGRSQEQTPYNLPQLAALSRDGRRVGVILTYPVYS